MSSNQARSLGGLRGLTGLLLFVPLWTLLLLILTVWVPLLSVVYVLTAWRDPGRYAVGRVFRFAAVVAVALNPLWRFRVSGVSIDDIRRPYVIVANHESYADIFLISQLPWEMKWLSKAEILKIPIMGWLMRMAGDIGVHRGRSDSRARALEEVRHRLGNKVSVVIFPEGTRSQTDEMLPFRDGAFRAAIEMQVPVLPLVLAGTRDAMRKGSFVFCPARAELRVLEPIPTEGLSLQDLPWLREETRRRMEEARAQLRQELE